MSGCDDPMKIIHGVIDPEARAVASRLGIEKIFGDREAYRHEVEKCIAQDLSELGLKIWQSGVKEIEDSRTRKDGNGTRYVKRTFNERLNEHLTSA
jgi:uncharacterized membrane protein YqiK